MRSARAAVAVSTTARGASAFGLIPRYRNNWVTRVSARRPISTSGRSCSSWTGMPLPGEGVFGPTTAVGIAVCSQRGKKAFSHLNICGGAGFHYQSGCGRSTDQNSLLLIPLAADDPRAPRPGTAPGGGPATLASGSLPGAFACRRIRPCNLSPATSTASSGGGSMKSNTRWKSAGRDNCPFRSSGPRPRTACHDSSSTNSSERGRNCPCSTQGATCGSTGYCRSSTAPHSSSAFASGSDQ